MKVDTFYQLYIAILSSTLYNEAMPAFEGVSSKTKSLFLKGVMEMKHKWNLLFSISVVLGVVFGSSQAHAIMWARLGASQFSYAARTSGANGFECTVQDVTEENGVRHVTCLVGDVISGNYQTGETRVLNFNVGSSSTKGMTLRLGMVEGPSVVKGYQYIMFTTPGNFGTNLIGGTANGFFQGTKNADGKTVFFNGYNNMNLVPSPTAPDYGTNSTVKLMQTLKTSGLTSEGIKNIIKQQ